MASLTGIDHVLLSMPLGGEDRARAFYGNLLGLREVPKPSPLDARGGCWFVGGAEPSMSIHLGVEDPFIPARKAHVALLVDDLGDLRARLTAAGVEVRDDASIAVRRFYAFDPFGNRLELIDARDAGFSERHG
jgi:catechol 2,3-dioxygenase-like lactoylglutathione lyase family enzyme